MLWFISEHILICGFELFIEDFLQIPMEKMNGKNSSWNQDSWKSRRSLLQLYRQWTFPERHLMQRCVAVCVLYMWPFHQHLLPLEVHFPPFLARSFSFMCSFWVFLSVSLIWLWLKALKVLFSLRSVPDWLTLKALAICSDTFNSHKLSVLSKQWYWFRGKKEKNLALFPPANFNVYISF